MNANNAKHVRSRDAGKDAGVLLLATITALAAAAAPAAESPRATSPGSFQLSVGTEFTTGEYGGDRSVDELYIPLTGWYRSDRMSLRLTVPYLRVDAPAGTIIEGPGGQPIPGDGPDVTESGLGDVVLGMTLYDAWKNRAGDLALDLGGSIKLGTADEDKGLGTGQTDFTLQADLVKFLPGFTAIGSVGYVFRGDPDGFTLDDGLIASVGGLSNSGSRGMRVGAFLDYREAGYEFNDDRLEALGMVGWRMDGWGAYVTASVGLSDSAPDWGLGLTFVSRR
ncbi:transporter [Thioalkalivibrio sp. XN279]|uniref:transporter n=1 Tax=Thioalkalivibrio sp. XN279 TaxID=2714953 RepID=UPI001409E291|nr:transporter [Thioalkalivibrio sp. XN279]NHA13736.1 transporter [Thioalkalivibrio sp. XN279]